MEMKQTQKIEIKRLGGQTRLSHGGVPMLESLNHTSEIKDINQVYEITVTGDNIEDFINMMPKSHKWKLKTCLTTNTVYKVATVKFDTFFLNNSTGDKNESAIKRREKVIQKLSKLGL